MQPHPQMPPHHQHQIPRFQPVQEYNNCGPPVSDQYHFRPSQQQQQLFNPYQNHQLPSLPPYQNQHPSQQYPHTPPSHLSHNQATYPKVMSGPINTIIMMFSMHLSRDQTTVTILMILFLPLITPHILLSRKQATSHHKVMNLK